MYRSYRAALTVDKDTCTSEELQKLFVNYHELTDISKAQRIGATFIVTGDLRDWFDELASHVLHALNEFEAAEVSNV
ncbi:hypothetical protein D3C85_1502790 [compost metagenome]